MAPLRKILRHEVEKRGVIPFAQFMETALYHPEWGYYETKTQPIGPQGDFYTSASVGTLFGELLIFQFLDWLEDFLGQEAQLVEAGGHDGQLAADILGWLHLNRPEIAPKIQYWMVEPSPRRQYRQRERLDIFAGQVQWFDDFSALPLAGVNGVIFGNELLDAMPVHRLGWDAKRQSWFEWGVNVLADQFVWERISCPFKNFSPALVEAGFSLPLELERLLPDDFTIEISPKAGEWWRGAARALRGGRLVALDYGLRAEEFLAPHRVHGTARAYDRHHVSGDLLRSPGEQDLTAHVNFTHLQRVGEAAGLTTELYTSQEQFLARIATRAMCPGARFGEWTPERVRQFQTLTHPEHLGRSFQVLAQSRQAKADCNS
jgi:SAM-dependent MidA family methyltransferase